MSPESVRHLFDPDRPVYREVDLEMRNRTMAYLGSKRDVIDQRTRENEATIAAAKMKAQKAPRLWRFFAEQDVHSLEAALAPTESDVRLRQDLGNALMDITSSRCDRVSRVLSHYIKSNLGFINDIFRAQDTIGNNIADECGKDAVEAYICLRAIDPESARHKHGEFARLARNYGYDSVDEMIITYEALRPAWQ